MAPTETEPPLTMIYHDNEIEWSGRDKDSTIGISYASFLVQSFDITKGQDPKEKNKVGDVHTYIAGIGPPDLMSFDCGRSLSKGVADWFNKNFKASETSFNHTAGELNFAFMGELTLTIWFDGSVSPVPGGKLTVVFPNFGLAQGRAGAYNNWWIAMQGATNKDGHLLCVDKSGDWLVSLWRSDNGVNDVWVSKVSRIK